MLASDLATCAAHWLAVSRYRYRQVRGLPTPAEADTVIGLLDLAVAVDPSRTPQLLEELRREKVKIGAVIGKVLPGLAGEIRVRDA